MTSIANPIFRAKVSLPQVRPPLILRPQLHERLHQGLLRKLTLISAPAGYGKTTLLAEWAATAPVPIAWLSLDNEDNSSDNFIAYFWSALDRVIESPDWPALSALGDLAPFAALQRILFNLEQAAQPMALVLDDYHVIGNPAIHQATAAFLDRLPPHLHLFIATRKDPPIPLARLRAQGELVDVRAEHLRFSPAESAEFLAHKMGLRLATEDLAILADRTEGWATGLQLAALSLLDHPDPHPFIQSLSGSHRFILDYLIEEVLNHQPPEIQTFLLHTSLLRRLSGPLCAALLAIDLPAAGETLAYLETANLFLTPLDPTRQWFRYHHLFADLLKRRLVETEGTERVARLHVRAANWYHEAGEPVEAIHHALDARDWPTAAEMMAFWGTEFFKTGAMRTYLPMLRALPVEALHRHPQLLQDLGWALALTNDLEQASHYLTLAEAARSDQPNFLGETLSGQAYVACYQFELDRALELSQRALELLDPEYDWMRSVAAMVKGLAHWSTGDPQAAQQAMHTALHAARRANSPRVQKTAQAYLGKAKVLEMDFLSAEEMALRAIGADPQPQFSPGNEVPAFDLAALYYEWNDLNTSEHYLEIGFAANEASGNQLTRLTGLRTLARLRMAQGEAAAAWTAAQEAVQFAAELRLAPFFQNLNAACYTEIALAQCDLDLAEEWAGRITSTDGLDAFHPLPRLAQARLWIARKRPENALSILAELEPQTAGSAWRFARFRVHLLQAVAAPQRAPALLGLDVPVVLRQKLARSWIDLGEPVTDVLRALPSPAESGLAERLTALIDACQNSRSASTSPQSPTMPALPPLVEPLSEREMAVLRAMADGKSTTEIAAQMVVAESTIRSHIKNIFAKLDVHSRLQAVDQARRRRLI